MASQSTCFSSSSFLGCSAVKQLQKAGKAREEQRCEQQQRQHQSQLQRALSDAATTRPAIKVQPEDASWSDLRVHVVCAVVSLGGHQLLRMLQKMLRRRGDHTHRHSRGASSSTQIGSRIRPPQVASIVAGLRSRDRGNSNTARFL